MVDPIVSDENLFETVNNNEMKIDSILLSQPFMLATEKMYDNELNENASLNYKVENTVTSLNKKINNNVEIHFKVISNINGIIAKNEDTKNDYMVIDVIVGDNELNENANNNKVENNKLVEDKSQETLKEKIKENDMVVDRKDDNINDSSSNLQTKGRIC